MSDPTPLAQRVLIRQLAEREVDFVLVGGFAVAAHGYTRATEDIDLVFSTEWRSCERLAAVLGDLGAVVRFADVPGPGEGIRGAWLSKGGHFRFATAAGPLDALSSVAGLDYETLASPAARSSVGGTDVLVCSYDDLVTMKSAEGCDRDRLDLAELRRVRGEGA